MKMNASLFRHLAVVTALLLPAATQPSFAQTTATTDPVGFITVSIAGNGTVASPKNSFVSPTLTQPTLWQGLIDPASNGSVSTNTTGGTTITVNGQQWTNGQFGATGSYYVEIVTGSTNTHASGAVSDIAASTTATVGSVTTSSITTADNLTGLAAAGDNIRIRRHVTLSDLFGANNSAGLQASTSISSADEVLVYNGSAFAKYWYYDGTLGGTAGWVDLNFNDSSTAIIGPNEGVVVKRKATGALTFTFQGAVKTANTLIPIRNGINVLGTVSAKGLTLDTSGLVNGSSGLTASSSISTADEVTIYTGSSPTKYWYYDGSLGGAAGWVDLNFNPAGTASIAPGSAFIVKRKANASLNFNWPLPSPSSF